ncbi:MAG: hypothetical protein CMQ41_03300 [Gammaproteobacteria bacterium]|nr:hypothetical protein [Gammaproteobacteria bacterium]|tara:strand:+ start:589 stop:978 length:390 start_codon:yes stop_codon:yes gene_type:complete
MSEAIGTFELEHVSNTYSVNDQNEVTNQNNWRGSAEGYGTVYGTLTFGPIPLGDMDEKLEGGQVKWVGQGFLEDGSSVAAAGSGTWKKDPNGHIWHTEMILDLNDGSTIRSVGELALETLKFTGTNYSV